MDTIYVKPCDGGRVRQPERNSRVMPAAGDAVPDNAYWQRRLISGDVFAAEPPAAADATPDVPAAPPSPAADDSKTKR